VTVIDITKGEGGHSGRLLHKKGAGGRAGVKRVRFGDEKFSGNQCALQRAPVLHALNGNDWRVWNYIALKFNDDLGGVIAKNGQIAITYDEFVAAGVTRAKISACVRVLESVGIIKVTRGMAGADGYRKPSLYELTQYPAGSRSIASGDWAKIDNPTSAKSAAREARNARGDGSHKSWESFGRNGLGGGAVGDESDDEAA
jgi:hypothetical protein